MGGPQGHLQMGNQEKQWEGATLPRLVELALRAETERLPRRRRAAVGSRKWASSFRERKRGASPAAKLASRVCDLSACPEMGTPGKKGLRKTQMLIPVGVGGQGGAHGKGLGMPR